MREWESPIAFIREMGAAYANDATAPNAEFPVSTPCQWDVDEMGSRAGALVKEALLDWPTNTRLAHWEDMKQTAMVAFLEYQEQPAAYGYEVARVALRNYKWVHIHGLNGGWKSLAARNYTVLDQPLEVDGDRFDAPRDNLNWRLRRNRPFDPIARPVEWAVIARLDSVRNGAEFEGLCREVLTVLAGMARKRWYPEQLYRAASIIAMLGSGHTWEDVENRTNLDYQQVADIWWHYRRTSLAPYLKMTSLHQAIIQVRGATRLAYFEELSVTLLNQAIRKMIVFPHGIYTVSYKRRGKRHGNYLEGSLQKGRTVNGQAIFRAVSLGRVGEITKEKLLAASHRLEQKFVAMESGR